MATIPARAQLPAPANKPFVALKDRARQAWAVADPWHQGLREAYRWLLPERYFAMVAGTPEGQRPLFDHVFDPVGMQALEDSASQIGEAIHPWDQAWTRWSPLDDVPEEHKTEIGQLAEQYTRVCSSMLSQSRFHNAAMAAHKDFLITAGFLMIDKDPNPLREGRIRVAALPAHSFAIEVNVGGEVVALFRKLEPRARELDHVFDRPGTWSEEARKLQRDKPDERVRVEAAYYLDMQTGRWKGCGWECDQEQEVWDADYRATPLVCYRPSTIAGAAWACGPALKALPDVKVANRTVELVLRNASMAVSGIWMADDDGVLNPANIRLFPGAIIPKAANSPGLTPLAPAGKFDIAQMVLGELRVSVRRALYVTRVEERDMTAEEYRGRLQQQIREMRGMYGQLRTEFAEPVMLRVLDLAEQFGRVPHAAFEQVAQVELVGPLAQDVKASEVQRVQSAYQHIAGIVGPQMAPAMMKLDALVPWLVEQLHAEGTVFKGKAEIQAFAQKVEGLMAQLAAQQQAQQGGTATAAPADPQQGMLQ